METQLEMSSDSGATDLVPAEQKSEVGLGPSHDSWTSGWRLPSDSDELLPSRPVRTFNLRPECSPFGGSVTVMNMQVANNQLVRRRRNQSNTVSGEGEVTMLL